MKKFLLTLIIFTALFSQGFSQTEETTLQKVRAMILAIVPDSAGLANANARLDSVMALLDASVVDSGALSTLNTRIDSTQGAISSKANTSNQTFTGTITLPSTTSIGNVSSSELGYLDNVTGAIQTQLNAKQGNLVSGTNIKTVNGVTILGSGDLTVTGTGGADSATVNNLIQDWADSTSSTLIGTAETLDSLTTAFWNGSLGGSITITYPNANTIAFGGDAINLDPTALEINGSDQLTVVGGGSTFDSIYAYQRITALEDSISALRYTLNAILVTLDSLGYSPDLTDNTPPLPPSSFVAIGGTATDEFVSTWTDPTASDLDSIRFYAGSSNDSTALVWVEDIIPGAQTYTYRSLTAGTTYWAAVKAVDDSGNVSYFSNIDSATTTGGGGFDPSDLSPVMELIHNVGVTADANGKVMAWTDGTYNFTVGDTAFALTQTDSSIFCDSSTVGRRLTLNDAGGNPFDIGTGSMSIEVWLWNTSGGLGNIIQKDGVWILQSMDADGQEIAFGVHNDAYTIEAQVKTNAYTKNAWHHFVFSWDRAAGDAILFIDSVALYATDADFDNLSATDLNSTDPTYIYGAGSTAAPLGHIGVIRLYNYALTPAQVKSLYEFGRE